MNAIYMVLGITLFCACYHVNSAPTDVACGEASCMSKECKLYTSSNKYKHFIDISSIPGVQPPGHIIRIPFYVLGRKDALIVLSSKSNPDWRKDNLYEILIGGSFNRVTIRRRKDGDVLKELQIPKTISADKTTHFLLEITVSGEIILYTSQFKEKPLIMAFDPHPLPVKYISFGAYVDYYYNCQKDTPYPALPKHPLLNTQLLAKIDAENSLEKFCNKYDTWEYKYDHFQEISDINPALQPEGYLIRFPFYIKGKRFAHILLSVTENPNEAKDSLYEIVIGAGGYFHVQIRRRKTGQVLAKVGRPNLISSKYPVKFVLEITKDGHIALFSSHDPFTPLLTAYDPHPLPIRFLSFASYRQNLVQFYFNCFDDNEYAKDAVKIPLLTRLGEDEDKATSETKVNQVGLLTHRYKLDTCKHVQAKENEYRTFVPLKDIIGAQYEGHLINLPLLIKGDKNAHIALTATDKPNWETDNIYEFVIGGWDDTRVSIRRRRNGETLQEEDVSNSINSQEPTKFILSVTSTGEIVVFTDLSTYKPLIWASDPDPIQIKYISFATNGTESIDYYYDCPQFLERGKIVTVEPQQIVDGNAAEGFSTADIEKHVTTSVITINKTTTFEVHSGLQTIAIHPLLQNPLLYDSFDVKALTFYSKHYETWKDSYDTFVVVNELLRPNGFMLRFPFYVQGSENAHILLSTAPNADTDNANLFEIRLGTEGNTLSQIVRKATGEVMAKIYEQNVLSESRPLRVVIEISNLGVLKVYTAHNPFAPLLQALVPPLTQINYISFASPSRAQFYYNVNEDYLLNKPIETETSVSTVEKVKHPLLAVVDYPIGYTELFFKKYFHVYKTSPEHSDKYIQYIKLDDIESVRPRGYLLRFPFYIQGSANAHILLTPKENPSLEDNTYEVVIGGLNNTRIVIRKRINGFTLVDVRVPNVLSELRKKKFVLEVSMTGDIKLYSEDSPYRPLAAAFDPNPITFEYITFKNRDAEKIEFFYGNPPHENPEKIVAELLSEMKEKLTVNPLLQNWNNMVTGINIKTLVRYGKYFESWSNDYKNNLPLNPEWKPKGYFLRFPVFVQGPSDARILLSSTDKPSANDHVYEIVLGADNNTVSYVNGKLGASPLVTVYEQNILSPWKPVKLIIEVSVDGFVRVFTSHNPFVPLLSFVDPTPWPVKHISFSSPTRVQFFYNVNENLVLHESSQAAVPTVTLDVQLTKTIKHPLLAIRDYPVGFAEPFFAKYFKWLQTKPDVVNKYVSFVKLSDISNVQPEGYLLQLPFYVRAKANAVILLSKKENPTEDDDAYEIVLGGWGNSRLVIRKRINGAILADEFVPELLSEHRRKKFVFEISTLGDIRLYSENDYYRPLASAFDPTPIKVQYMSVKNYNKEVVDLYFGNRPEDNNEDVVQELIKATHDKVVMHPLLVKFKTLLKKLSLPILWKYSKYYESWDQIYSHFVKIDHKQQPEGYLVRFPVYVRGSKDARIMLSSTQAPDPLKDNVYEIRVGTEGNSLTTISRKMNGAVMTKVWEQNIMSPFKLTMLVVEVTKDGKISVWSSHNPWVPLITIVDPSPLELNYVSFASSCRVQWFYDVNEKLIWNLPSISVAPTEVSEVTENLKHPMLSTLDYPVGVASLYFRKYFKEYVTLPEQPDSYVHYVKVNDIDGVRPKGYLLRFPFYVQGSQMAHVLLASKENPTEQDMAYEIVIGDRANTRVVIRKKMNGAVLANVYWPNVLSQWKRKKFVFEVQTDGLINLWSEDNAYKPLLSTWDPTPVKMEYLSFKNWLPEKMHFYYGKLHQEDESLEAIKKELLTAEYKTLAINPFLMHWKQVAPKLTLKALISNSKYFESWQNVYEKYVTVTDQYKPTGYLLRFPVYVQGAGVAKILLSTAENPNYEVDSVYEIHLGWGGNSWSRILKNGVELVRTYEQNILNLWKPTKVVVEVTTDGLIKVFTSHNPWVPLMKAMSSPIDVKYVSFASPSRVQYFYDVNEEKLITAPVKLPTREVSVNVKYPLFNVVDYPIGVTDLWFEKYFKVIETKPNVPSKYLQWIKLDDVEGVRPNGYLLRFPFYLQGAQNAFVVVSTKENPTELDHAYELVIGGWKNSRIVLRKRINGAVLADVYWPNILSEWKKKKFVLEVTVAGDIYLYSEDFPFKPILSAFDQIPSDWKFNYLSFKNSYNEKLDFYYGYVPQVNQETIVHELLTAKYKTLTLNPLFQNWKKLVNLIDIKLLARYSKYYETWESVYTSFIPVTDKHRSSGYSLRFPFYVQGPRHARILLSSTEHPDKEPDSAYEIHIGKEGNTLTTIVRNLNGIELSRVYEQNILSQWKPVKIVIEITDAGVIKVFTSHNPFVPLITAKDDVKPISVKYISFASPSRSQFFYDVDEDVIVKLPVKVDTPLTSLEMSQLTVKHPLLAKLEYPIGLSSIFFRHYYKTIQTLPELSGNYTTWVKMSELNGVRPKGYLIRIPFYLQGSGNAHVLFSEDVDPTELDNAYELLIGGFRNTRVLIRKRINGAVLADVYWPNVLSEWKKKKFVFEVTLGGEIQLYSEDNPYKPMVTAFDPKPITIDYMSFRNLARETLSLYYGNAPEKTQEKILSELLTAQYGTVTVNPLLENWNLLLPHLNLKTLVQHGHYYESWTPSYSQFLPVADVYRPFGYKLRFPVYITGSRDANILLSSTLNPSLDDDVYEITLGWEGNSLARISKRINGEPWVSTPEQNILSPKTPVKVIVEVSNEGLIKVFTSWNRWAPLLTVTDPNPINIKYVSFSSSSHVQFVHDVDENVIATLPVKPEKLVEDIESDVELVKHPLFSKLDYPIGLAELFFNKFYKVFVTTPAVSNKYVQFVKLSELENSRPEGYAVRVPFYIRGTGNAHVLLSSVANPTEFDDAYELLIGGWNNKRIILRKRIQGAVLANVYWPNIITDCRRKKFVFEVTRDGDIKLYSDDSPFKPILVAYDPSPMKLEFISFKNYLTEKIEFFWGNNPHDSLDKVIDDLLTTNYGKVSVNPLFVNWNKLKSVLNTQMLFKNSKYYESWNDLYAKVIPIDAKWKPSGVALRFPFYVQGPRDAHIVLSVSDKPTVDDHDVYEIRIGSDNNALTKISRRINGDVLHRVYEQNLLSDWKPIKFVIELTSDGLIQVFSGHNPFAPLLSWKDSNPLPIKYISFGSAARVQYFWDVNEDVLLTTKPIDKPVNVKHPLLALLEFPLGVTDLLFKKLFRVFETLPFTSNKYSQFVKLSEFDGSRPTGYLLRFPFYVQGSANAHILVSPKLNPTEFDDAYEIVLGAWKNQRIIIRKRVNGAVLAEVRIPNVLSPLNRRKFVLDVLETGEIYLYGENDLYHPLVSAFDPSPFKLDYVSFKNYMSEKLNFYYGYYPKAEKPVIEVVTMNPWIIDPFGIQKPNKAIDPISPIELVDPLRPVSPTLWDINWRPSIFDLKWLVKNSKYYESWGNVYANPIEITTKYQPTGYIMRFPLYVQGSHDAYILLSTTPNPSTADENVYEIQIGALGNMHQITRKINGKVLAKSIEPNVLSQWRPTRLVIEVSSTGSISVYTAKNPYAPLISAVDPSPIPVKYVSLSSSSRIQYYFDINEESFTTVRPIEISPPKPQRHPLFVSFKITAGTEDLFFKTHFKIFETTVANKYVKWLKIDDMPTLRQPGYLIRASFFIQGSANAHIVLSPKENPTILDNAYEIVIGGFGNTRVMIRKRIDGVPLADLVLPNVLNVLRKKQFIFEITVDGDINLWSEDDLMKPLISAYDPVPIKMDYVSFKNSNAEKLSFYYGYDPAAISNVIVEPVEVLTKRPIILPTLFPTRFPNLLPTRFPNLLPTFKPFTVWGSKLGERLGLDVVTKRPTTADNFLHPETENISQIQVDPVQITNTIGTKDPKLVKFEPVVVHPLLAEILPPTVQLPSLVKNSLYFESWNNVFTDFIRVSGKLQPAGFSLRFPFYVQGPRDAFVLLSTSEKPDADEEVYEIQLGVLGNTQTRIVRKKSNIILANITEENVLNEWKPTKIVIEVTSNGLISVYSEHNPFAPLLSVLDPNPILIKHVSFSSGTRVQFFYDVNEKIWLHPETPTLTEPSAIIPLEDVKKDWKHPLLSHVEIPVGQEDVWFTKYFKVYETKPSQKYEKLYDVAKLKDVKPEGYLIRFPFYVEGPHSAHIIFAPNSVVTPDDNTYEIVIGGWVNSRVEIRKRWNGPILATAITPNVLSDVKRKKFVIEVTTAGYIRVYSEDDLVKPLVAAFDPKPINIKYLGFKNSKDEIVKFYFDYRPQLDNDKLLATLMPSKYDLAVLDTHCTKHVAEGVEFKKFLKISDLSLTQIDHVGKTFSFYVDGTKDASLLLSSSMTPNPETDWVYEILIGCNCNNKPVVIPHKLSEPLWYGALSSNKLVKVDVEIANGKIRLFRDNHPDPLTEASYDTDLDLNYISFGAANQPSKVQFYYNCSI